MLVTGVLAHIAIQVVLNIAVVTNVIPNTGITLPFISYGGTSVLFFDGGNGMVLSVSNRIRLNRRKRPENGRRTGTKIFFRIYHSL